MSTSKENPSKGNSFSTDLKAEQALGLIGLGLLQKMSKDGAPGWQWASEEDGEKADLLALRQRLELTSLAIETGAPLTTAEVTQLLGARPGSSKTQRGGLSAERISRNVWKLSQSNQTSQEGNYWRN